MLKASRSFFCAVLTAASIFTSPPSNADEPVRVLIIDGRNNHDWKRTTPILKATLERSGRFVVDVSTTPPTYAPPMPRESKGMTAEQKVKVAEELATWMKANREHEEEQKQAWEKWRPEFGKYAVVIDNYNGIDWPEEVKQSFVSYVREGGGLVCVHAANNCFANWPEFNDMLGLAYRGPGKGKRIVIDPATGAPSEIAPGEEMGFGQSNGHGSRHEFVVVNRSTSGIMANLPVAWMHGKDELYHGQRGPAANVEILASAYSDPKQRGSDKHEPVLWRTSYGKGRVVTTSLGHLWADTAELDALHCVGFQTLLARSAEWAATGKVTLPVPDDFPSPHRVSLAPPEAVKWKGAAASVATFKKGEMRFKPLPAVESVRLIELPKGYHAEVVASEPMIEEPVWCAWDGNGAMYVAEMNSYMQDAHGTGTKTERNGRIKRLVDTDGDGRMDKVTVFAENLLLPRMILALDDRILIQETYDSSIWSYRDTDGDGVADEKLLMWKGRAPSNSVEHQDSALTWNLDNWLYTAEGGERHRFTRGKWETERCFSEFNQWGMGMDDVGNLYYSQNSIPGRGFQQPWYAWNLIGEKMQWKRFERPSLGTDTDAAFQLIYPIFPVGDRGEDMGRSWTSACGLSIYRGDALPAEMRGAMMLCEPCSHLVRRAKVETTLSGVKLSNMDGFGEFFASRDFYTRPVATMTGPDGCLYVVDMYRGIIQDSPWVGPEFVERIEAMGMDKVKKHGRIYRIVQDELKPAAPPKLLGAETADLVRYLSSANGWTRDTAQKLIVLRADKSVAPDLAKMATHDEDPLARLHALWTLEGLDALELDLLAQTLRDADPRVRAAAVRLHEPWLKKDVKEARDAIVMMQRDTDSTVLRQVILSLGFSPHSDAPLTIQNIAEHHPADGLVFLATMTALHGQEDAPLVKLIREGSLFRNIRDTKIRTSAQARWKAGLESWKGKPARPRQLDEKALALIEQGITIYQGVCTTCHGADGKGVEPPGQQALAPALAGSAFVQGPKEALVRVLLCGLTGPVQGRPYAANVMAPLGAAFPDDFTASVLSYIRQEWVNNASVITASEVAAIRKIAGARTTPFTEQELAEFSAAEITDKSGWHATAAGHKPENAIDGVVNAGHDHAWHGQNTPGYWLAVDLGKPMRLTHLIMESTDPNYYPREFEVRISDDGKTWSEPISTGHGEGLRTLASFEPVTARYVKIIETARAVDRWMVSELHIFGTGVGAN